MDIKLLLLLLKSTLVITQITGSAQVKWIVAELRSFHIVPSCLTEICGAPQFRSTISVGELQLVTSSIQLNQSAIEGVYDRFVYNPIQQIELSAFEMRSEVVGTDPTFNFMRICDSSPPDRLVSHINHTQNENELSFHLDLHGKCFKASLRVDVHSKRCPWCLIDASSVITNEERSTNSISMTFFLACSCIALGATTVLILTMCTYFYKSNQDLRRKLKRTDTASSPSTQITESHYDLPWKTYGYRNLRMVRNPYESVNPPDEFVRLSPNNPNSEHASFAICLGTTHRNDGHEYNLCKSFESSGRGSV
ncbi:hypothetical protein M3Y98_00268300 [Aphelenchoides besseyi]|nr:hypothetical protein M3Y98_00268300 [Aphelenchoides besseyi]KAI6200925.1 hypothetical protein M3Y96_00786500 [Aphelenchoides besseyi]